MIEMAIVQQMCAFLFLWLVIRGACCTVNNSSASAMLYTATNLTRIPQCSKAHRRPRRQTPSNMDKCMASQAGLVLIQRTSLVLMMVCLSNDVQLNPGPDALHPPCISVSPNGIRICHWNVRSFNNTKFEEIRSLLTNDKTTLDVLIITETWLDDTVSDSEIDIPGFKLERKDRLGRKGGGVLMYIGNDVTYNRGVNFEQDNLEMLCVKVTPFKSNCPLFLAGLYRPPDSSVEADKQLETALEQLYLTNKEVLLLGDMNINALNKGHSKHYLTRSLSSLGLHQLIYEVTRPLSQACLDHAYTTHPQHILKTKVYDIGMSDHLPVCIVRKYQKRPHNSNHMTITYRSSKNFYEQAFQDDLEQAPWNVLDMFDDPDDSVEFFNKTFLSVANAHMPLVQKRVKKQNQPPWMTPQIYIEIKKRDELLKVARRSSDPLDWEAYKQARNATFRSIREAKSGYFQESLENSKNSKEYWKHLKKVIGSTKKPTVSSIRVGGSITHNPLEMANAFNEFFVSVAEKYRSTSTTEAGMTGKFNELKAFVKSKISPSTTFEIPSITPHFIAKYLRHLQVSKATGLDGISAKLLRAAAPVIANPLAKIINESITKCIFPSSWKLAKVTPVYKAGDHLSVTNYRPISILPILSKVLERHVHVALYDYLNSNNLLCTCQSGFRPIHSCETALINLVDTVLTNMDNGLINGLTLIDYRKAFDLVDHEILLTKLDLYGLTPRAVSWFKTYLNGRQQKVSIQDNLSDSLLITSGVPQGSILGPLLFIVFINDLPLHNKKSSINIYADDTTELASGHKIDEVESILSNELSHVNDWARNNKMALNCDKTKCMVICSKPKLRALEARSKVMEVSLNNQLIEAVSSYKLLGLHLDSSLTWDAHVEYISKKLSKRLGLLKRCKKFLTSKARKTFYCTLIQPIMDYGAAVWGSSSRKHKDAMLRIQKRSARIILDADWNTESDSLLTRLHIVPFHKRVMRMKLMLVYKALNGMAPPYIAKKFMFFKEIHSRNTRNAEYNFIIPRVKRKFGEQTFAFSAAQAWNNLPLEIKKSRTVTSFSNRLSSYVF